MEKRQLDFNAPLLSVRRFSSPSNASKLVKTKVIEEMSQPNRNKSDWENEELTIPFHWEQIPGRPKSGVESQIQTPDEPSNTPRLPPGWVSCPTTYNSGDQNIHRDQTEASLSDHARILEKLKETLNCKNEFDKESHDYDSDAPDRISQTEFWSLNYSVSGLSGCQSPGLEQSGTFTVDIETRDFMMDRFLPAAKAAVLETPKYVVKKPRVIFEERPKPVKKVVLEERNPLLKNYGRQALPYYNEYINNVVESEDEETEFPVPVKKSGKLSWRIIPRFCVKNSLCLISPSPGSKSKIHAHKNASHEKKSRFGMISRDVPEIKNKSCVSQLRHYRSGSISPYRPTIYFPSKKSDIPSDSSPRKVEGLIADQTEDIKLNQSIDESRLLECTESGENLESSDDEREYDRAILKSPLPPPLPKSPTESWLWRTLPSIPLGDPFFRSSHFHS
ncbi:hypothetical protein BUALT_Bualt18G0115800 [Buddleja alternifolia]|uniref:Uncharacterized protein n=1 Tax=Buddleja alternifolia TaxID=168488 RepID=A0AAV6W596_9LAMI|nr:hypothetical protein BUALT_Bualt18G0115800 [Buddleja alternifolia]